MLGLDEEEVVEQTEAHEHDKEEHDRVLGQAAWRIVKFSRLRRPQGKMYWVAFGHPPESHPIHFTLWESQEE